jgi:fucose permease
MAGSRRGWTAAVLAYVALLGMLLQLRGALLPVFEADFGVSPAALGLVSSAASLTFLVTVFAVGVSIGRLDGRRLLALGLGGGVLALIGVASAPTYSLLLAGLGAKGVAAGTLHGTDRPLLSHLYPDARGRAFNFLDAIWAVGAATGPLLATAALAAGEWRYAYMLAAALLVPVLAYVLRADLPAAVGNEASLELDELLAVLRRPTLLWLAAAMLLLSFVESGFFTWLPYYAGQFFPQTVANLTLTGFLLAYVPGRFAFGYAAGRLSNIPLVLGAALSTTALLVVAFVLADGYAILAAVLLTGFLVAGMFPTLSAWGANAMPEHSGPVNAVAMGISGVGFLAFPALMGVVVDLADVTTAMRLLIPAALGLVAVLAGARTAGVGPD